MVLNSTTELQGLLYELKNKTTVLKILIILNISMDTDLIISFILHVFARYFWLMVAK